MILNNLKYELQQIKHGCKYIAGVDEVGRGPLAGPLVVCAVILDLQKIIELYRINDVGNENNENTEAITKTLGFYTEINDSKLISDNKRRKIKDLLLNEVVSYSLVEISNSVIDKVGIAQATQHAFFNSVQNLKIKPDHVLTDMFKITSYPKEKQTNIKSGDKLSMTIGAASIIAKVYRDNLMIDFSKKYPQYGFEKNKGYGTKQHMDSLKKHGPCTLHRKSFEPVKSFVVSNREKLK